jgi:hypothetical protein
MALSSFSPNIRPRARELFLWLPLGTTDVAENFRSMRGLEHTASTSRVLNLAALALKHADNPEHLAKPLFLASTLNAAVILKHRLRGNEIGTVSTPHRTATKLIVPFERSDLGLGGRSLFVGDRGWLQSLEELVGVDSDLGRDAGVLEALDELPSLDPFLVREQLKRRGFDIAETHFEISSADLSLMHQFVRSEISKLIALAYKGQTASDASSDRLVGALLSSGHDERLEPLRLTLRLGADTYREGIFAWKGFLYYKWVLNSQWPKLREILSEMMRVKVVGPRDQEQEALVRRMKVRLHGNIERHMKGVADYLRVYDGVFLKLTQDGNGTAFRDFLLSSPEMLVALGEGAGVVNHIASFWRFRFPKNRPLEVNAGELLDILQDFESGLGGDIPAIAA